MTRMVADWNTIFSLPLKAAPKAWPPPSLVPRMLVTSSSRVSRITTMPGATPETVLTTLVGSSCRAVSAMMKFLPAKKMKLPRTSTLSTSGSTTRPNALSTSRYRSEQLLADLPDGALLRQTLYAPVGLDIGAENPQSIALAIVAEIQAVLAGRPAGRLPAGPAGADLPAGRAGRHYRGRSARRCSA